MAGILDPCISTADFEIQQGLLEAPTNACHTSTEPVKRHTFALRQFISLYESALKPRLLLARERVGGGGFTFHLVHRYIRDHDGEEGVRHLFASFGVADEAIAFMSGWYSAQNLSAGVNSSCLMECGPGDDSQNRKWVLDIDGSMKDLGLFGLLDATGVCTDLDRERLHASVLALGSNMAQAFVDMGFASSMCHFAVKTRHRKGVNVGEYRKLSWHVTLLLLAPYTRWRDAILQVERSFFP